MQLDHCGPFQDSQGDTFWILTVVDRFSNKLWASTVETPGMAEVIIYLLEVVFQTMIPSRFHADRAFTNSQEFKDFAESFKIKVVGGPTSQSQGHVEVMNREIQKKLLRLGVDSTSMSPEGFQVKLTRLVLEHNMQPLQQLNWLSPNEVLLGWKPDQEIKSGYFMDLDQLKETLEWRSQLYKHLYDSRKKTGIPEDNFKAGDLVLMKVKQTPKRQKNAVRNWGPFIVLENYGNGLVKIQYSDGGTGDVSSKDIMLFVHDFQGEANVDQKSGLINKKDEDFKLDANMSQPKVAAMLMNCDLARNVPEKVPGRFSDSQGLPPYQDQVWSHLTGQDCISPGGLIAKVSVFGG